MSTFVRRCPVLRFRSSRYNYRQIKGDIQKLDYLRIHWKCSTDWGTSFPGRAISAAGSTWVLNGSENESNWKISSTSPQYEDAVTNDDAVEMHGVDVAVPSGLNAGDATLRSSMLNGSPLMTLTETRPVSRRLQLALRDREAERCLSRSVCEITRWPKNCKQLPNYQ